LDECGLYAVAESCVKIARLSSAGGVAGASLHDLDGRPGAAAAQTTNAKKIGRLGRQARAAIRAILTGADRFVTKKKGPISADCGDAIEQAFNPVLGSIDANRF